MLWLVQLPFAMLHKKGKQLPIICIQFQIICQPVIITWRKFPVIKCHYLYTIPNSSALKQQKETHFLQLKTNHYMIWHALIFNDTCLVTAANEIKKMTKETNKIVLII